MQKVPCGQCGALILPTTAASTGGICMPCKMGTRESLEQSRKFYEEMKEYDPFRELWISLVNRSSKDRKLASFTDSEKIYFSVSILEGEIYNGGFDQFFSNSSGDYFQFAVSGLKALGAESSLLLLMEASNILFGSAGPPADREARWAIMSGKVRTLTESLTGRSRSKRLEELDKRFCEDADDLIARLTNYANEHGLVDPFKVT